MNFTCKKEEICAAIQNVSKAVAVKSTISALEGIRVKLSGGILELTGYDLEMSVCTTIEADSADSGEFIVNAHLFNEMTRKMSDETLRFEVDELLNIRISGAAAEYFVSAMSAEEYPDLPVVQDEKQIILKQSVLKSMIRQTCHAVSQNENKPVMTGELFELTDGQLTVVASDGYRLALRREAVECPDNHRFVVPARALSEVSRLLKDDDDATCAIYSNYKHIVFAINNCYISSRLLEGEFHNYRASIPTEFRTEVLLKTRSMTESLDRCALLINEKNKAPVRCVFENGTLSLSCKTGLGTLSDSIPIDLSGDTVTIGLNNKFMLDALRASECDKVKVNMSGGNRVVKISPLQGESFIFLVMPIDLKA